MLKMVDGTGIIGVDMICPLGVSTPQPPNYDKVELEGTGILVLPNSLDAPLERLELIGNIVQGFSNLVFVGYTETEENVIKEYEAVDDGMSAYGKLQNDLKATQAAQEVTDQAVQELILATMKMGV